jgi:hypothetical protein
VFWRNLIRSYNIEIVGGDNVAKEVNTALGIDTTKKIDFPSCKIYVLLSSTTNLTGSDTAEHIKTCKPTSGISGIFSGNFGASGPCPLVGLYSKFFRGASPRNRLDALVKVVAALEAACPMTLGRRERERKEEKKREEGDGKIGREGKQGVLRNKYLYEKY